MALPQPKVPLKDICSVIHKNTLYTYQSGAFQSLELEEGAKWKKLASGVSVEGGACVETTPQDPDQAGLFVVGGRSPDKDYHGLQKFTYSTGKWESIKPEVSVTQERLWHGAVYINSSNSILIYGGSQDGSKSPSTQTFTVGAASPYSVRAYQSIAPPVTSPILMSWSDSEAVLVGGSDSNTKIMLFNPDTAWVDSGATLSAPLLKDVSKVKAVMVNGDDGSKSMYTFDMTKAPNEVNRTVLLDGSGNPVQKSVAITGRSAGDRTRRSELQRREGLTLDHWPKYNSTLAPKATRSSYAVADDADGLVVFAGGNEDDVLCMFDGRSNTWQNATSRLVGEDTASISSFSPTSTSSSSTTSPTAGSTKPAESSGAPAAAATATSRNIISTGAILGIALGTIAGLALLLMITLWFLRRHRSRQLLLEAGQNRRASGFSPDEKNSYAFATEGLPQHPVMRGHQPQGSQSSYSSMAILMGKMNSQKPAIQRKPSNDSNHSSDGDFSKDFKNTIGKPILQQTHNPYEAKEEKGVSFAANVAEPRPRQAPNPTGGQDVTRRSSGWNRYWSGGSALNLLGFGASKRTTADSDQSSEYSTLNASRITQDSATVPALNIQEYQRPSLNRVQSSSPTIANYNGKIREGMTSQIERPSSRASSRASSAGYSSGIPPSVHEAWDPIEAQRPWGSDRAPSSAYSASSFTAPLAAPSTGVGYQYQSNLAPPPLRQPSGISQQPQLAMAATSSDMSWLNLGEHGQGRG